MKFREADFKWPGTFDPVLGESRFMTGFEIERAGEYRRSDLFRLKLAVVWGLSIGLGVAVAAFAVLAAYALGGAL